MKKRWKKRLLAERHDSRRYLKHHPPRRSRPSAEMVELAQSAVERYAGDRARVRSRQEGLGRWGRRAPSAEQVLLRALPYGVEGEAYLAVEWALQTIRPRPSGRELAEAAAKKLWEGGVQIGHIGY